MSYLKKGWARLVGETNGNWKGGLPKCLVCKKQLSSYSYKYCLQHRPARKGLKKRMHNGYWIIYKPEHLNAGKNGYIKEHRIIMEESIGRVLRKEEIVHHINHVKTDNRIENLMILNLTEHNRLHNLGRKYNK